MNEVQDQVPKIQLSETKYTTPRHQKRKCQNTWKGQKLIYQLKINVKKEMLANFLLFDPNKWLLTIKLSSKLGFLIYSKGKCFHTFTYERDLLTTIEQNGQHHHHRQMHAFPNMSSHSPPFSRCD